MLHRSKVETSREPEICWGVVSRRSPPNQKIGERLLPSSRPSKLHQPLEEKAGAS
jgi:hypothetical protein